jgi:DNA-binding CsgD family transcriptional regulator
MAAIVRRGRRSFVVASTGEKLAKRHEGDRTDALRDGVVRPPLLRVDSGNALLVLDTEMRIQSWNDRLEKLVDRPASEIRGRRCWEVLDAVSPAGDRVCREGCTVVKEVLDGIVPQSCKVVVGRHDDYRPVWMSTLAISQGGSVVVAHVIQDESGHGASAGGQLISLTPRQREMLQALAAGRSTRAIARQLTLSELTIRNHISGLLAALDCHTRLEAVAKGHRLGLIEPGLGSDSA